MDFQTVHGTQAEKPQEYEFCGNVVFVRKDIRRITVTQDDEEIEMWEYEEAKATMQEFVEGFAKSTADMQEAQQSQIDYIAMMNDIDLEG